MNYIIIAREVLRRIKFHAKDTRMLQGLKIKKSGTFRIDGNDDLPQFTLIDLSTSDQRGTSRGTISCFLRTKRKYDWFKEDDQEPNGLIDWVELIMDALETRPSDGKADQLLTAHNKVDDLLLVDGAEYPLLAEPFGWEVKMAEISDLSFTMQMDISFVVPQTKRGRRRSTPIEHV